MTTFYSACTWSLLPLLFTSNKQQNLTKFKTKHHHQLYTNAHTWKCSISRNLPNMTTLYSAGEVCFHCRLHTQHTKNQDTSKCKCLQHKFKCSDIDSPQWHSPSCGSRVGDMCTPHPPPPHTGTRHTHLQTHTADINTLGTSRHAQDGDSNC